MYVGLSHPPVPVPVRRRAAPLVVAGVILVVDAVVGLALTAVFLAGLPWWLVTRESSEPALGRLDVFALPMAVCAVLALWGPAAAALVIAVRRRWARLAAGITAGVLVVAAAAQGAVLAGIDLGDDPMAAAADSMAGAGLKLMVGVVVINLIALALLIGPSDGPVCSSGGA
jgi:hypothetical protein